MKELSIIESQLKSSPIRVLFEKARGRQNVIAFTVGEPDFNTPQYIVDAAVDALNHGAHHYPPNAGFDFLREAVSRETEKTHGIKLSPMKNAMITLGGMEALYLSMLVVVNPGDEVIIGDPAYCNYAGMALMRGAKPVPVPCYAEDHFAFDLEAFEKAITPKTKAVVINSPMNPTGGIASYESLKKIAELCVKHDLYVFSDEVYQSLVYDGNKVTSIATFPGMQDRTVIINSFSKKYAMCGWRIGYAIANEKIIDGMSRCQEHVASGVNAATQYAALAALQGPQDDFEAMLAEYSRRRDIVVAGFSEIKGLKCYAPEGTFYAFIDVSETGMTGGEFVLDLLDKAGVILVPGDTFGTEGRKYVRLVFATSEENIREGIRRIKEYMEAR